jgi:hypothetical protein
MNKPNIKALTLPCMYDDFSVQGEVLIPVKTTFKNFP